jgi:hypothetical protein
MNAAQISRIAKQIAKQADDFKEEGPQENSGKEANGKKAKPKKEQAVCPALRSVLVGLQTFWAQVCFPAPPHRD